MYRPQNTEKYWESVYFHLCTFEIIVKCEKGVSRDHSRHYSLDGAAVLSVVSRALKFKRL